MGILKKSQNYILLTLDDEHLRVAYLKPSGVEKEVVQVLKRDIRGISEEELPNTIRSTLDGMDIKNSHAICVIPSSLTTMKNIEIPSLDPQEIQSIVNLQAGRHTPYSREEIIIGYINIGVYQRNYSKILLVIANRSVIKKKLDILSLTGFRIEKVLFAPETTACFYSLVLNLSTAENPIGIIDVGSVSTDFIVCFKDRAIACRNIPLGMSHLVAEGPAGQTKLLDEFKKSVESYRNEDIEKMPESYILTTDNDQMKNLRPVLQEALGTTVKIVPYLDNIKNLSSVRKSITEMGEESFLDIIAPTIVDHMTQVDLIPEEIKAERAIQTQGFEVLKSGIFLVIIFIFVCAIFLTQIYFKSSILNKLKTNYKKESQQAEILENISAKTRLIKDYLNNRMVSLETINELYKIIPDEIYLKSFELDEKGTINIQGTSESMSLVFSLVTALEDSDLFKNVKTKSTTAQKERGKDVAAFEISFKLENAPEEEELKGEVPEEKPKKTAESSTEKAKEDK